MKFPKTLRSRIVIFFCGYLAILLTLYTGALSGTLNISEDLAFNRQVSEIADRIRNHIESHGELPPTLPLHITAYFGQDDVPSEMREFVSEQEPGAYEVKGADVDCHVAIVPIPSAQTTLYVFYDVSSIEKTDRFESIWTLTLVGIALGVFLLGWGLARSLANGILTPITDLAGEVQALSLGEKSAIQGSYTTPDEVGTLAGTINQLLKRIGAFTCREREFTSHASHELRTPVTVIKGAMEILKNRSDKKDPKIRQPLERIQRAVTDIELLIDTFLLLARQDEISDQLESSNLEILTRKVVASHQYLLASKPVEVEIQASEAGIVQAPSSLVTIVLGNLVRNAFKYTSRGRVEIWVLSDRVRVIDTGPGMEASKKDQGLGLTIVTRLCDRMGWQFTISGTPGGRDLRGVDIH